MKKGNEMGDLRIAMSSSASTSDLLAGSSFGQRSEMKGWFTMKKLMFAAAVAAGVMGLHAEVVSQVVGYQNCKTGKNVQMVIPTFADVADGEKVMLSKIGVTGYEDTYTESFEGFVMMTMVDEYGFARNDGAFEDPIQWDYVAYDEGEGWVKAWYDSMGTGEPITSEDDREITYGEGLYLYVSEDVECEIKLSYAGAVAPKDNQYDLISDAVNIVGNPMPTQVGVGSIDVVGFEEVYAESFEGVLMMTKVDQYGFSRNDSSFENPIQWDFVAYDEGDGMVKAWYDSMGTGEAIVPGEEVGEQIIEPGEGLYINMGSVEDGVTVSVVFPSPLVDHSAE